MSFLFGSSSAAETPTKYTGVQIQTSSDGVAIPVVIGRTKTGGNLIEYVDFEAHEDDSAAGGKMGGGSYENYTYTANVAIGICQGPVTSVPNYWLSDSKYDISNLSDATLFLGSNPQTPWGVLTTNHPERALGYTQLAYIAINNCDLSSSAAIPNYNWEVQSTINDAPNGYDCHPYTGLKYLVQDGIAGLALPAWLMDDSDGYVQYAGSMSFFVSYALSSASGAGQVLSDIIKYTGSEILWASGKLKFVPYCGSAVSGNGYSYTPPATNCFAFTDADYISSGTAAPVKITRKRPSDAYNDVKVEYLDRSLDYAPKMAQYRDQNYVESYGLRPEGSQQCHFFTDATAAYQAAQLRCQRNVAYLNEYSFTVGWKNVVLDPMDIGVISDTILGLENRPVRIKSIKEDGNMGLTITCEDYFEAVSNIPEPPNIQQPDPTIPDMTADPGSVSTPIIFEPASSLTDGTPQVWIATRGIAQYWGGCQIWGSTDGDNYTFLKNYKSKPSYGVLVDPFPSGADPDTANTLIVNLSMSQGSLTPDTQENADLGLTQCIITNGIDDEYINYSAATLLGTAYNYQLDGYIRRGQNNTEPGSHAANEKFLYLDNKVWHYTYSENLIGQTLYLKFISFNIWGGMLEDLSEVQAYPFVLSGKSTGSFLFADDGTMVLDDNNNPVYC